jgi:crotonobetainyl-CoA:carnitine CoA-transferase CaiB-like acyl-CoA transferase
MSTPHVTETTPTATAPLGEGTGDGPLSGVRVLDVGTVYAAPITAMLLGDYGADVLKIEHPRGDPARTHGPSKDGYGLWWKVISRNKRAATLVLSHPKGRELLEELVADADVLIENFRPGVMEKWGIGPERLLEINPELVMLRVTGFGQTGPYAHRRAFGTLAEAMSGLAHQTGQPDGPPTSSGPCPGATATARRTTRRATRTGPATGGGWRSRPARRPSRAA